MISMDPIREKEMIHANDCYLNSSNYHISPTAARGKCKQYMQIILMLTVILTLDFISLSSLLIPSLIAVRACFEAQYITLVPDVD